MSEACLFKSADWGSMMNLRRREEGGRRREEDGGRKRRAVEDGEGMRKVENEVEEGGHVSYIWSLATRAHPTPLHNTNDNFNNRLFSTSFTYSLSGRSSRK